MRKFAYPASVLGHVLEGVSAMAEPGLEDHTALSRFLHELYRPRGPEGFAQWAVEAIPRIVGSELTSFNTMALSVPRASFVTTPELEDADQRMAEFAALMHQHPCIRHVAQTGDHGTVKISDFLSAKRFHQLDLYQRFHKDLGVEDQMGFMLDVPGREEVAIALARPRRSFTERDRRMLELLRPHVSQAYRRARSMARLRRALHERAGSAEGSEGVCLIELTATGRVVGASRRGLRWLHRFFDGFDRWPDRAPRALVEWVRARGGSPAGPGATLGRRRGGERLLIRVIGTDGAGGVTLALQRRSRRATAEVSRRLGLTAREVQVLRAIEAGLENVEVAAALGVSPRTVEKHLQNVYEKLGVRSRTAAVARLRWS